jgi:hypothetical protein
MAVTLATTSPFKKNTVRNNMAYYFDDDRLALIEKNSTTGEWKSISTSVTNDADKDLDHRMVVHYHSRYTSVTGLEQDLNTAINLKYGLHLALLDYVRARIMEDQNDMQKANYYYQKFKKRVKQYPYRKSAVRGINPFSFR